MYENLLMRHSMTWVVSFKHWVVFTPLSVGIIKEKALDCFKPYSSVKGLNVYKLDIHTARV